jgi:hypothetical protein
VSKSREEPCHVRLGAFLGALVRKVGETPVYLRRL